MKKLKFLLVVASLMLAGNCFAQKKYGPDSLECIKYLSYYQEYYKQKAYDEALPNWRKAYSICPATCSQNMLLNGQFLVRRLISANAKNEAYKKALIDTLMTLHELRIQNYPKYAVSALNSKGQDVYNYLRNDNERAYKEYTSIIEQNGAKTKPTLFVHQFNAAAALYKADKLTAENLISLYQESTNILSGINAVTETEQKEVASAKNELEGRFVASHVADCNTLLAFYGPKYDDKPNDPELATNIVRMLGSTEGCTDNDLFLNAVTSVYNTRPSYTSAYYLYRLNAKNKNESEAIKYIEEAIAFTESNDIQDAEYYMEMAQYCFTIGRRAKAFEAAQKSASLDPSKAGKAYYLIGNIWAATGCGGGIDGAKKYWVAVDYMIKAKNADPSLASEANICIGRYSACFPEVGEAFMYGLVNGMTTTVSCGGMSAATTVRLRN